MSQIAESCDLLLVGTGSLATSICSALPGALQDGARIIIVGRDEVKAQQLCAIARTTAQCVAPSTHFGYAELHFDSVESISGFLGAVNPRIILNCASLQSPWEGQAESSRWTEFIARAGFGVTLPFQAAIAQRLLAGIEDAGTKCFFVNACFPDAVNPLLNTAGSFGGCGVGNIATIAAFLQESLERPDPRTLRMLAHHTHLRPKKSGFDEVRVWLDDEAMADVGRRLVAQRDIPRIELNRIAGLTAALLIRDILSGASFRANLPGPLGLPGGYPVRYDNGHFEIDLPYGVDLEDAIAWNQRAGWSDGLMMVEDGVALFTPDATKEIEPLLPQYAREVRFAELDAALSAFDKLRSDLRRQKPLGVGAGSETNSAGVRPTMHLPRLPDRSVDDESFDYCSPYS